MPLLVPLTLLLLVPLTLLLTLLLLWILTLLLQCEQCINQFLPGHIARMRVSAPDITCLQLVVHIDTHVITSDLPLALEESLVYR